MAIYKPTFCSPIEGSFEITTTSGDLPVYIECQIDTSNTLINGYSIELFDEDGNRKFPDSDPPDVPNGNIITSIYQWKRDLASDPNIDVSGNGMNGTKLKFPFIVTAKTGSGIWSVANNQKIYNDTTLPLENNKKYFWRLTLYQLAENNNADPSTTAVITPADKLYDMSLTTGTVLGSTNERIQTVKSDNIAIDYYVQPVLIENLSVSGEGTTSYDPTSWTHTDGTITNVGSRALIKSYDSTNGHIYPVVGSDGIQDTTIKYNGTDSANGIRIYKMSNNESDLNAYQKVAAAPESVIPWTSWKASTENPGDSYGIQEYYVDKIRFDRDVQTDGTQYFYPFDVIKSRDIPLHMGNETCQMKAPIGANSNIGGGFGNYMLSRPQSGNGLYATYPGEDGEKSHLILDSYTFTMPPVYYNYSNHLAYWFGIYTENGNNYAIKFSVTGDPTTQEGEAPTGTKVWNQQLSNLSVGAKINIITDNSDYVYYYNRNSFDSYKGVYLSSAGSPGSLYTFPTTFLYNDQTWNIADFTSNLALGSIVSGSTTYSEFYVGVNASYTTTSGKKAYGTFLLGLSTSDLSVAHIQLLGMEIGKIVHLKVYNNETLIAWTTESCSGFRTFALYPSGTSGFSSELLCEAPLEDISDLRVASCGESNKNLDLMYICAGGNSYIYKYSCNGSNATYNIIYSGATCGSLGYLIHKDYFYFSATDGGVTTIYYFPSSGIPSNGSVITISGVLSTDDFNSVALDYYKPDGVNDYYLCFVMDNTLYYYAWYGNSNAYWWSGQQRTIGMSSGSQPRIILNGQYGCTVASPANSAAVMARIGQGSYPTFENVWKDQTTLESHANAFNGIYYPTFSTETISNDTVKVSVRWTRVPDANTWGEISTKIVMVNASSANNKKLWGGYTDPFSGKNVQINRTDGQSTTGTINSTPFYFDEEKPIDLYEYDSTKTATNPEINNTGLIFYNRYVTSTSGNMGYLYIRPFTGLHAGQKYFDKNDSSNAFTIAHVDDLTRHGAWFVNYTSQTAWISALKPDEDKYRISTYFNTSDEYWFKTESKPSLTINAPTITASIPLKYDFTATYTPGNDSYTFWNSYQWQLYEDSAYTTPLQIADVKHSGEIKQTFYGLTPGKTYYIRCVLTTNSNRILEAKYSYTAPTQGTESTDEWYTSVTTPLALQTVVESDLGAIRIKLPNQTKLAWTSCSVLKREWWIEDPSATTPTKSYQPVYTPVAMNITDVNKTSVLDYNIGDNHQYEYIVFATTASGTTYKTAEVEACWMGTVLISLDPSTKSELGTYTAMTGDSKNVWHFRYNLEANSETLNMAHNVQTTLAQYPSFSYGPTQYLTGGFSCLLGDGFKVGDSGGDLNSHTGARSTTGYYENLNTNWGQQYKTSHWAVDRLAEWRKFCASATPKLLKDEKGQVFLVQVTAASNQTNVHWNKQPETITFDWTEIGDSSQLIVAAVVA